jgi:hypothetical protein
MLFLTLEVLVLMGRVRHENRLERILQQLAYPRLMILDEPGYLSREQASLLPPPGGTSSVAVAVSS